MSSFFEEYHSVLGKTCKKNPHCPSRLLASTVILINYELNVIHNTYVHSWFKQYMRQMIKQ